MDPTPKSRLEELVGDVGAELFALHVQDEVDRLLADGQALEPAARQKLVAAAIRGVQMGRPETRHLETLLFDVRRERNVDISTLAKQDGIDPVFVAEVEKGMRLINDGQRSVLIARWANCLGLDESVTVDALRRSLTANAGHPVYAGGGYQRLNEADERFISEVASHFRGATLEGDGNPAEDPNPG